MLNISWFLLNQHLPLASTSLKLKGGGVLGLLSTEVNLQGLKEQVWETRKDFKVELAEKRGITRTAIRFLFTWFRGAQITRGIFFFHSYSSEWCQTSLNCHISVLYTFLFKEEENIFGPVFLLSLLPSLHVFPPSLLPSLFSPSSPFPWIYFWL